MQSRERRGVHVLVCISDDLVSDEEAAQESRNVVWLFSAW